MSTLSDLVASIHTSLHSYTGLQEQVTWLTSAVDASTTTLPVADANEVRKGVVEVDDELMYAASAASGSVTLAPFGRGYRGSTAATHAINAAVASDPAFPKVEIKRAINQTVESLFPTLWQQKTYDIPTYTPTQVGYDLPTDCEGVSEVKIQYPNSTENVWIPLLAWEYDNTSPEVNGKAVNILPSLLPGTSVRITYRARFGQFAANGDTLASVGLPESCADLLLYAVSARMIRFLDPARLQVASVENVSRAQVVQAGDAGRLANQLYATYQTRLQEERLRLLKTLPSRPNFTGR